MARVPVDFSADEQSLRPAQSVLPIPYAPALPRAAAVPFEALAGLSGTLAKISLQQKERENEAQLAIGQKLGNDAGDDLIDQLAAAHKNLGDAEYQKQLNQAAFLKAEKAGDITPAQNEWRTVGFTQSASRRVMAKYESDLIAAQTQATSVVDKDGNPTPAKPVEQVIQETWSKYKDNPFFQDYYGAKESNNLKVAIDARYRQDAANKLAGNMAKEYQDNTANEFSRWATTQGQKGETDEETLANFNKIANEHRLQGVDVSKAALDGFKLAAANVASTDDGSGVSHAATLLRLVSQAKIGNTTIGEDARTGPEIKDLIQHYENEGVRLKQIKLAGLEADEHLKQRQAASEMDSAVTAMKTAQGAFGFPPVAQSAEMDRFINQYQAEQRGGTSTRANVEYLRSIQRSVFASDSDAKKAELLGILDRSKDPGQTQRLLDVELAQGTISANDFRGVQNEINNFTSKVAPLLESPSSKVAEHRLAQSASTDGLPPGAGESWKRTAEDLQATFVDERTAFARTLAGLPAAQAQEQMDSWNKQHGDALVKQLREGADAQTNKYIESNGQAVGFSNKLQQVPDSLLTLDNGFSPAEITHWKEQNRANADRRARQVDSSNPAFDRTVRTLTAAVIGSAKGQGLSPSNQAGLALAIESSTRDSLLGLYDSAASSSTDPAKIEDAFNKSVGDFVQERGKALLGENFTQWEPFFKPVAAGGKGKTGEQAIEAVNTHDENVKAADNLRALPSTDRVALSGILTNDAAKDPNVPKDLTKLLQAYHQGQRTGLWGLASPNTEDDANVAVYDASNAALIRPDLKDTEKQDAITHMHAALGIPAEDLLKGSIPLTVPPSHIKALSVVDSEYKQLIAGDPAGVFAKSHPEFYARVKQAHDVVNTYLTQPAPESPIRDGTVNLFTTPMFKDNAELQTWADGRREDLKAILAKHGAPTTDATLQRLYDAQRELNLRRSLLAR
jgi:hypothetical protein